MIIPLLFLELKSGLKHYLENYYHLFFHIFRTQSVKYKFMSFSSLMLRTFFINNIVER